MTGCERAGIHAGAGPTTPAAAVRRNARRRQHPLLGVQRAAGNRATIRLLSAASPAGGPVPGDVEARIERARGGGSALDAVVRASMESGFGTDFSDVRVHTGAEATSLSSALGARAFTTGHDVFFRAGEYAPGSSGGRELLAHELTHVVQQAGPGRVAGKLEVGRADDPAEREADELARAVSSGRSIAGERAEEEGDDR